MPCQVTLCQSTTNVNDLQDCLEGLQKQRELGENKAV